jgi:hypothetical protein
LPDFKVFYTSRDREKYPLEPDPEMKSRPGKKTGVKGIK